MQLKRLLSWVPHANATLGGNCYQLIRQRWCDELNVFSSDQDVPSDVLRPESGFDTRDSLPSFSRRWRGQGRWQPSWARPVLSQDASRPAGWGSDAPCRGQSHTPTPLASTSPGTSWSRWLSHSSGTNWKYSIRLQKNLEKQVRSEQSCTGIKKKTQKKHIGRKRGKFVGKIKNHSKLCNVCHESSF